MTILETSCDINLQYAKWASRKTRSILSLGADNLLPRPANEGAWEFLTIHACVQDVKSQTDGRGWTDWEKRIADAAELATKHHCGNCGEHAAVAFMLLNEENVRPLDFVGMKRGKWSHNFVVIGRENRRSWAPWHKPGVECLDDNGIAWGPSAVVCDPFNNQFYPAGELLQHPVRKDDPLPRKSLFRLTS